MLEVAHRLRCDVEVCETSAACEHVVPQGSDPLRVRFFCVWLRLFSMVSVSMWLLADGAVKECLKHQLC